MTKDEEFLRGLANAIDAEFISRRQSTAAWQKQLDAALQFLLEKKR